MTLTDCSVHDNLHGGAAYHYGWAARGAAIYNSGSLTLVDGDVTNNDMYDSASSYYVGVLYGGGIYQAGSYFSLDGTTVTENDGAYAGGGLFIAAGNNYISNCAISDNEVWDIGGIWAGLYYGGAGVMIVGGATTIDTCTFSGNVVTDVGYIGGTTPGGAISVVGGTLSLTLSTLYANEARYGAGLHVGGGAVEVYSSTVGYNLAADAPSTSGVYVASGTLSSHNSLYARNGSGRSAADCSGTITSDGYNLVGVAAVASTTTCSGLARTDIYGDGTVSIASGLAATLSTPRGSDDQVLQITPSSAALDAGDPAGCTRRDQTGRRRPIDGDRDGVSVCDIGAFERR